MTMSNQFYKMTLTEAIDDYQKGLISATTLLYYYLKIKIGPGWQLSKSQKEICEKLGISKSGFYTGLSKLKAERSINFQHLQPLNTVSHCQAESTDCPIKNGQIGDSSGQIGDSSGQIGDSSGRLRNRRLSPQIGDSKTSKPVSDKGSSDSPDLYSDSYQIFIKSLSEGERENFLEFLPGRSQKLPKPPTLPMKWIERNAEELRAKWESFCGTSSNHQSSKFSVWANHPRFNELWQGVCTHGTTGYVVQNIRDTTIKDFCKFCYESPEITEEILSCLNSH
jgi:hypothetical protein